MLGKLGVEFLRPNRRRGCKRAVLFLELGDGLFGRLVCFPLCRTGRRLYRLKNLAPGLVACGEGCVGDGIADCNVLKQIRIANRNVRLATLGLSGTRRSCIGLRFSLLAAPRDE